MWTARKAENRSRHGGLVRQLPFPPRKKTRPGSISAAGKTVVLPPSQAVPAESRLPRAEILRRVTDFEMAALMSLLLAATTVSPRGRFAHPTGDFAKAKALRASVGPDDRQAKLQRRNATPGAKEIAAVEGFHRGRAR